MRELSERIMEDDRVNQAKPWIESLSFDAFSDKIAELAHGKTVDEIIAALLGDYQIEDIPGTKEAIVTELQSMEIEGYVRFDGERYQWIGEGEERIPGVSKVDQDKWAQFLFTQDYAELTTEEKTFIDLKLKKGEKVQEDVDGMRNDYVENCIRVLKAPKGTVQQKMYFCKQKGATDQEILAALNTATDGEVVKTAMGEAKGGYITTADLNRLGLGLEANEELEGMTESEIEELNVDFVKYWDKKKEEDEEGKKGKADETKDITGREMRKPEDGTGNPADDTIKVPGDDKAKIQNKAGASVREGMNSISSMLTRLC